MSVTTLLCILQFNAPLYGVLASISPSVYPTSIAHGAGHAVCFPRRVRPAKLSPETGSGLHNDPGRTVQIRTRCLHKTDRGRFDGTRCTLNQNGTGPLRSGTQRPACLGGQPCDHTGLPRNDTEAMPSMTPLCSETLYNGSTLEQPRQQIVPMLERC